jgi:ATP-dependent Clp protease ATP-binding subunit ClpB
VLDVVGRHFRPEFINRIDEVVVFHPLLEDQIKGIAEIQLGLLNKRLKEQELQLQMTPAAMDKLAKIGFDPVYGARPLKRAIQQLVENPLAQNILLGTFSRGDLIVGDVDGDRLSFTAGVQAVA